MATTIYNNLSLTDRAMNSLMSYACFRDSHADSVKNVAFLAWSLLRRAPGKDGLLENVQGPHFVLSAADLDDLATKSRAHAFRIDGRILCVEFSRDWNFDPATPFRLDFNDPEFILYPAALDEGVGNH
jgi:hypothetical protein